MTKVQIQFHLQRPLDDTLLRRISDANSVYGIETIRVQPSMVDLTVEYDASRLRPAEVTNALCGLGIPVLEAKKKPASA